MLKYEIVVAYPKRANGVIKRIANHLQSMATNEFGITFDFVYNERDDDAELQFTLRTNDYTQTGLNIRDRIKDIVQQETYVRPCYIGTQHIVFAKA